MPDLLGPAMAAGARIRRRRRTAFLAGLTAAVVLAAGGLAGGLGYLGGDGEPAPGSVATQPPSADRAAELAAALDKHVGPRGWSARPETLDVRSDGGGGGTLRITVRRGDAPQQREALLELSVGAMSLPLMAGQPVGTNCEVLMKLDRYGPQSDRENGTLCVFKGEDALKALVWDVSIKAPKTGEPRRWGVVRLGPERELVRAWAVLDPEPQVPASDASDEHGIPAFDNDVLTAIAADAEVASLVRAVSDSVRPSPTALPSLPTGHETP
jgi:hypothetical protein